MGSRKRIGLKVMGDSFSYCPGFLPRMMKGEASMFCRIIVFFALCVSIFAGINTNSYADDFGCKVLLCLASPGGPMQYEECRPTIRKLYNRLYNRKPFPKCDMESGSGVNVEQGIERCVPCEEAYGEGYAEATVYVEVGDGGSQRAEKICRKFIRTDRKYVCADETGCRWVERNVYSDMPIKYRREPYYVEVHHNGEQKGQRFYYKKKSKKKGGLF